MGIQDGNSNVTSALAWVDPSHAVAGCSGHAVVHMTFCFAFKCNYQLFSWRFVSQIHFKRDRASLPLQVGLWVFISRTESQAPLRTCLLYSPSCVDIMQSL